jgi:hypothetical protein
MAIPHERPRIGEMVFRLYGRLLHPELFDVLASRVVARDGYTLSVRLTRTGHVIGFSNGQAHLSELTATATMELPQAGRRLAHKFDGGQSGRSSFDGGVRYQVSSQLEVLQPEQFQHVHAELAADGARKGLVFHCRTDSRLELPPLGVVIVQTVPRGLSTHAFHTFPAELAIIKTQSLIEWK